jgi:hypothetical protein
MNIIQAVKYMMRVLIPSVTPVAGEGIAVAKEKEGSVISATFPGWVPHDMVYVANATNAAWTAGMVVALGAAAVSDPEDDTLTATIPTAGADGQFAVLSEDIAVNSDGLAAVTGLAVAKMSAGFTEAFAAPDGLGGLAGATSGPFRVIYANSTAQTALVAFAGGGGAAPVEGGLNYVDQFYVTYDSSQNRINVSGGIVVNGTTEITCAANSFSSSSAGTTRYIVLSVSYNNSSSTYTAVIQNNSSLTYPSNNSSFTLPLASVYWDSATSCTITYYRSPAPVYITNRWS